MEGYKSKYTGREIEKKLDKIDITNFIGKFTDDSTEVDWNCTLNGTNKVTLNVNPVTKEFKEVIDFKIDEELTNFEKLFYNNEKLEKLKILDVPNINKLYYMFYNCSALTTIDLSNFDTSKVSNMWGIFMNCSLLTTLDLSSFDTSKVVTMHSMFHDCSALTTIDLSSFDTSKVADMNYMFMNCSSLTTLDLSNFDISHVSYMEKMFSGCSSLTTLDLSNFDISINTLNITNMFNGCSKLTYIKCKQAFKDFCIQYKSVAKLPDALKEGGSGTWDIVA